MLDPLPEGWASVRIGEILMEAQYGLSLPMHAIGKYPILRMNAIQEGIATDNEPKFVDLPEAVAEQYLLQRDDVLFNRTNSAEWVGKAGLYRGGAGAVFASYLIRLIPKPTRADRSFLGRLLASPPIQARLRRYATPGVQQVNINATNVKLTLIPLPPLPEQQAIAAVLDAAGAVIERTRAAVEAARRVKRGLVQQFFEAGLGRVSCADSPNAKLANGWRLVQTVKLLLGEPKNGISPNTESAPPGFITFSIAAVRDGRVDLLNRDHWKYARISADEAAPHRLNCGDLLIVRGNANPDLVGKCGIVEEMPADCIYPDILKRVHFDTGLDGIDPRFAEIAWNHAVVHNQILKRAKTSNGTLKVNSRDVKQVLMPVPPRADQERLYFTRP